MKQGLRFIERNAIIKALRSGLPWEEAKKAARTVDPKALDAFKVEIEAEAKRGAPGEKVVKLDPEEFRKLREENANLRRALDDKDAEVKKLQAEIESLILDDGKSKKK